MDPPRKPCATRRRRSARPRGRHRGELALAEGKYDEAWTWAERSLERAQECRQRKHAIRATRLQGAILSAQGRLEDAAHALSASLDQSRGLGIVRESWLGDAALGAVLTRLGRDREAESRLTAAADAIESIAARLVAPHRRRSFSLRRAGDSRVPHAWPHGAAPGVSVRLATLGVGPSVAGDRLSC
jgi:tetratricopeptide (TPR) repeat protein